MNQNTNTPLNGDLSSEFKANDTLRFRFLNKLHFTKLRDAYAKHLVEEFNFKDFPMNVIDNNFSKLCGYSDINYLMSAVGNQQRTDLLHGTAEYFAISVQEYYAEGNFNCFEALLAQYAAHMNKEYGMKFKEPKLKAKFSALLGHSSIESAAHELLSIWLGAPIYISALKLNIVMQSSSVKRGKLHSVNIATNSRIANLPLTLKPSISTISEVENLLFSSNSNLRVGLEESGNHSALFQVITDWVMNVGVRIKDSKTGEVSSMEELEDQFFVTDSASYHHSHVNGTTWSIKITRQEGAITMNEIAVAMRQINEVWEDVDLRGHYNTNDIEREVLGLELMKEKSSSIEIQYSSTFRGKLQLAKNN